jgi:hypothetical protein
VSGLKTTASKSRKRMPAISAERKTKKTLGSSGLRQNGAAILF